MKKCKCSKLKKEPKWCPCVRNPHSQLLGHCVVCGGQLKVRIISKKELLKI